MRLYLNADSKNNIGYIPDFLCVIDSKGNEYIYDVQGGVDYDSDKLSCRVKGDLYIERDDDYEELSEEDEVTLKKLLEDQNTKIKIIAYHCIDYDEDEEALEKITNDEFTNCFGSIEIQLNSSYIEKNFTFTVEVN